MLTPRPKISALPPKEDSKWTVDSLRAELEKNALRDKIEEVAERWATVRLLAGKIGDARAVMNAVFSLRTLKDDENHFETLNQRLREKQCMISQWETTSALNGGNLEMGISAHAYQNADLEQCGIDTNGISTARLIVCARKCEKNGDWHNAIAAYERARSIKSLKKLAEVLEAIGQDDEDESAAKYSSIAKETAESLKEEMED